MELSPSLESYLSIPEMTDLNILTEEKSFKYFCRYT